MRATRQSRAARPPANASPSKSARWCAFHHRVTLIDQIASFIPQLYGERARPKPATIHDWRATTLQSARGALARLALVSPRFRDVCFPLMREHLRVVDEPPEDHGFHGQPGYLFQGMLARQGAAQAGLVGAMNNLNALQGLAGGGHAALAAMMPAVNLGGGVGHIPFGAGGQALGGGGQLGQPAAGRQAAVTPEREDVLWLRGVGKAAQSLARARKQIDSHRDSARAVKTILFVLDPAQTAVSGAALRVMLDACSATDVRIRMVGRFIPTIFLPVPSLQTVTHIALIRVQVSLLIAVVSSAPKLKLLTLESPVGGDQQVHSIIEAIPRRASFAQLDSFALDMRGYEDSPDLKAFAGFLLNRLCKKMTTFHLCGSSDIVTTILKELSDDVVAQLVELEIEPVVNAVAFRTIDKVRAMMRHPPIVAGSLLSVP